MKKHFGWALASAMLVGSIGSAYAADMPLKAPPPVVPVFSWAGWYAGLNAGGVWGDTTPGLSIDPSGNYFTFGAGQPANIAAVQAAGSNRYSTDGFTGGGQVGYNWQVRDVVFGAEADFEYFNPRGSSTVLGTLPALAGQTCANSGGGCAFAITNSSEGRWLSTLRARFGIARDHWLFYGTAGLAVARLNFAATYADTTTAPPQDSAALRSNFSVSQDRVGYAAGVGGEYAFNSNWSIRAEYLYLNFDHGPSGSTVAMPTTGVIPAPGTCPPSGAGFCQRFNYSSQFDEHVARVAINYHFYRPVVAKY